MDKLVVGENEIKTKMLQKAKRIAKQKLIRHPERNKRKLQEIIQRTSEKPYSLRGRIAKAKWIQIQLLTTPDFENHKDHPKPHILTQKIPPRKTKAFYPHKRKHVCKAYHLAMRQMKSTISTIALIKSKLDDNYWPAKQLSLYKHQSLVPLINKQFCQQYCYQLISRKPESLPTPIPKPKQKSKRKPKQKPYYQNKKIIFRHNEYILINPPFQILIGNKWHDLCELYGQKPNKIPEDYREKYLKPKLKKIRTHTKQHKPHFYKKGIQQISLK